MRPSTRLLVPTLASRLGFLLLALLLHQPALAVRRVTVWYEENYRPDPDTVLATFDGEPVTELDLYLWQTMLGRDPLVIQGWQDTEASGEGDGLRPLESALRRLLLYKALARQPEAGALPADAVEKGARLYAGPAAEIVYAEEIIGPQVQVRPQDIAHYYNTYESEFSDPTELVIRRLRVPFDQPPTESGRAEARRTALALRAQAREAGGLLPILRTNPDFAVDTFPDLQATIEMESGAVTPAVERVLEELEEGRLSRPIATEDGMLLVEVLERRESPPPPTEDVAPRIREILHRQHQNTQVGYQLTKAFKKSRAESYAKLYPYLTDEMPLFIVRDFEFFKSDFEALFPDLARTARDSASRAVTNATAVILRGEVMTQELELEGATDHPIYKAGEDLGRTFLLGRHALRERLQVTTPEDGVTSITYLAAHRDELFSPTVKTVWRLRAVPEEDESRPRSLLQDEQLLNEMRDALRRTGTTAERLIAERADLAGPSVFQTPDLVLERISEPDGADFEFELLRLGEYGETEAEENLGLNLEDLEVGRFTAPRLLRDGTVGMYYTATERARPTPSEEALLRRADQALRLETALQPAKDLLAELERSGRLTFAFPVRESQSR